MQSPPFELIDIVVRAGAGAGKTTELTHRVLRLAEVQKAKTGLYPHFVVTTFTRKATQELKERLLTEAMKRNDTGLVDFVKRPSQLHISTIHGVLSSYLSRFGSILGLSPQISIVSDSREKFQLKKIIRELCQNQAVFNEKFQALLESSEFSDLLGAFAQFFKLKMQFGEIPFLSEADFFKILSEKSKDLVRQMKEVAVLIRGASLPEAWQELAFYCEKVLGDHDQSKDLQNFWLRVIENFPAPRKSKQVPDEVAEARDRLKDEFEFFQSWRVSLEFWQMHTELCEKFAFCAEEVANQLFATKLFSGEITMQDLETLSLRLIRQHPETAAAFSKQWDYWLVDEYQDTSPAQVELIKSLSQSSRSFVVGDPQQSIYLFRGARSEVFAEKEKLVQKQNGILFSKLINYRSQPELLEFFNFIFTSLSSQFRKMQPKSEPQKRPTEPVAEIFQVCKDAEAEQDPEFEAVLYRCQELVKKGASLETVCVLSRSNRDLEDLAWLAQKIGVPVQVHSAGRFFERREIVDALSLLKFLCNPHDNRNLLQILRSPLFRVPDQSLYEWSQEAGASYWLSFSKHPEPAIRKLQQYLIQAQSTGAGATWRDLLVDEGYFKYAHHLDPSGRREANLWKLIQKIRSEERRPGFSYLEFLKNLDLRSLSTEEVEEADAVPVIEPQKVHLMTVHASKGLQFSHVILPKLGKSAPNPTAEFFLFDESSGRWTLSLVDPEEGKKVSSLSGWTLLETLKNRQREEEDRVLYVAMTRAKESVTLIWEEGAKKASPAARLALNLDEGLHQSEFFSYQVRKGRFQPEPMALSQNEDLGEIPALDLGFELEVETFSVTEILDKKQRAEAKSVKTEMADVQKAVTGVDVHRILESLKYRWMKDSDFDWQNLLPELSIQHQKALQYVALDRQGQWLEVIRQGEVEFGLAVQFDGKLIQGQIDLWGFDSKGEAWVIDYKTGSPRYQEKAFQQLQIYCWALQKIKKIEANKPVNLAVIYPFSESTLIRRAPSLEEIERELRSVRS
ncbi:MAG: UvrD-helicase domain-containing protein [Pseudobdellovibrionaceae bacterium]